MFLFRSKTYFILINDFYIRNHNNKKTTSRAGQTNKKKLDKYKSWNFLFEQLDLLPFKDYATSLPHLIHTANSSLVDIRLVNLTSAAEYNSTRFALHLLLVSTDRWSDSWNYTMRQSLDDEHTPGVFEVRIIF